MKHAKKISLGLLSLFLLMLYSCGEAGIEVKVGGDYETDFAANQPGLEFLQTFNDGASTTVNSEIEEYGDFITELEVRSLTISFENFRESTSTPLTGEVIIEANGIEFRSGNVVLDDGTTITLSANQSSFNSLSNSLRSRDVSIALEINADAPFGDNDFDVELAIAALATVKVD